MSQLQKIKKLAQKYRKDEIGSFATWFALSSTALLLVAGAGIDTVRMTNASQYLQDLNDSAALAAGLEIDATTGDRKTIAKDYVETNFKSKYNLELLTQTLTANNGGLTLTSKAVMKTEFMKILGRKTLTINALTEVDLNPNQAIELAIVVDQTSSMASFGSNWTIAVDAFGDMVETMAGSANNGVIAGSHVSIIPFSDRVNLGPTLANQWHDETGIDPATYLGCLEPRENPVTGFPFLLDDSSPDSDRFTPSAPGFYLGLNPPACGGEITPPTKFVSDLEDGLNAITPSGTGRFDVALAWGWRILSPNWRGEWGVPNYPSNYNSTEKSIIFMTDGFSTAYETEVRSPGTDPSPWGWNNGQPEAFNHFEQLCDSIKETGIKLHMVYLQGNNNFQPHMERCASSPDHYFEVSSISDLTDALQDIGKRGKAEARIVR